MLLILVEVSVKVACQSTTATFIDTFTGISRMEIALCLQSVDVVN